VKYPHASWRLTALSLIATLAVAQGSAATWSADALYNAGNAYARQGKAGLAVLNYQRARLLAPGDPDVAANLLAVQVAAHVPVEPQRWTERAAALADPAVTTGVGILGLVLIGAAIALGRVRRPLRALRLGFILVGGVLLAMTGIQARVSWQTLHAAVVLVDAAPVLASPVPMADPLWTLHEAEMVRIGPRRGDFTLIHDRRGQSGWIANRNIAPVMP
jgi:hypothetical protein